MLHLTTLIDYGTTFHAVLVEVLAAIEGILGGALLLFAVVLTVKLGIRLYAKLAPSPVLHEGTFNGGAGWIGSANPDRAAHYAHEDARAEWINSGEAEASGAFDD